MRVIVTISLSSALRKAGRFAMSRVVTMVWWVTNNQLLQHLNRIEAKVDILMTQQDDINAAAQEIQADVAKENTALAAIQAEIAALQAGNPALDLAGLQAAVGQLDQATAAEEAVVPPTP